jgi:hypothetical protein
MISTRVLKEIGWGTASLTEDLEFTRSLHLDREPGGVGA